MNYSTRVMLINDKIRAIRCSYEPAVNKDTKPSTYLFKTLDDSIVPGDYVVVGTDTRHKMTVNKVEEVDCEVDFDSGIEVKWIVGKVDRETYEAILKQEETWVEKLKAAEIKKKRKELKKDLIDYFGGDEDKIAFKPVIDQVCLEDKTSKKGKK